MTTFTSPICLGEQYKDDRFGIQGFATAIFFQEHGCVEVHLAYNKAKEGETPDIENHRVNELRLVNPDGSPHVAGGEFNYETDIVLGRKYRDTQTGLEAWAAEVQFWEDISNRVLLRSLGKDKKDAVELKYHSIDDFLLEDVDIKVVAERKDEKRSPLSHEVADRR